MLSETLTRIPLSQRIPPLHSGDRLTADEFERRFDAARGLRRGELIDGVVFMPPPVSDEDHGAPHFDLVSWLAFYRFATPGISGGIDSTLRLDPRNRPQPDACLRILPEYGGQVRRDADGYLIDGPDLVAEVAASSASHDLSSKLELYRRYNVREYVVWRTYETALDWRVLRGGRYDLLSLPPDGIYRSEAFPGLWLDPAALFRGDATAVYKVVQQGLASPEHAAFVAKLQQAPERP